MGRRSLLEETSPITRRYVFPPLLDTTDWISEGVFIFCLSFPVHTVSGDCWGAEEANIWRLALGAQRGLLTSPLDLPFSFHALLVTLVFIFAADAELSGVHVPWPGIGERIQYEPHHAQTLAGKHREMSTHGYTYTKHAEVLQRGASLSQKAVFDKVSRLGICLI